LYTYNSNKVGWIIASIILEGAGVIPLLLVLVGLVRLMFVHPKYSGYTSTKSCSIRHAFDFPKNEKLRKTIVFVRMIFFVGVALLISGSSLIGNYEDESLVKTGRELAKAGYLVLVFILAIMVTFAGAFWLKIRSLCDASKKVN
jgi:uncharacterized membrane protein